MPRTPNQTAQPIILLAGPTASGKSSAAIALAQKYGGVIINADSMQVYKELRLITARPSEEDEALLPHSMYGHTPGKERYSTGKWAKDVRHEIDRAQAAGKRPIITGGTGLYFRALTDGLVSIPNVPDDISVHWRAQATRLGAQKLHTILSGQDPIMAEQLKPGDTQRITRALEVLETTGKSLSFWQQQKDSPVLSPEEQKNITRVVIAPPRDILYRRINKRLEWIVETGGLEEVQNLKDLDIDPGLPIMRALGVPELLAYLNGDCTREEAIERASMMSRRYAKRQMTWLRSNMPYTTDEGNNITWTWVKSKDKERLQQEILSLK